MKITIVLLTAMFSLSAHATRLSALQYGLSPETGYIEAVTPGEVCNAENNVRVTLNEVNPLITKCDGSTVGWVTKTVRPGHLQRDLQTGRYDFKILLGTGFSEWGYEEYINIYACDATRSDELKRFPQTSAARDAKKTFFLLNKLMKEKKAFEIELFFNDYVLSGKCIGQIKELK